MNKTGGKKDGLVKGRNKGNAGGKKKPVWK